MMQKLNKLGFKNIGNWQLTDRIKSGVEFNSTHDLLNARCIYAFVVNEKVKYVGICEKDTTNLKDRLKRYQHRNGNGQNHRIIEVIKNELTNREVHIYALSPSGNIDYNGIQIDLVKGLENTLIKYYRSRKNNIWNK